MGREDLGLTFVSFRVGTSCRDSDGRGSPYESQAQVMISTPVLASEDPRNEGDVSGFEGGESDEPDESVHESRCISKMVRVRALG